MASEKNKRVPRRPNRPLLVLMCLFMAVVIAVNGLLFAVAAPYFNFVGTFLADAPNNEQTQAAGEASRAVTREIASEGMTLLKNEGALPLPEGRVNILGTSSADLVFGGTGSGAGDASKNVSLVDGLAQAGLEANPDLVSFYQENAPKREQIALVGTDWSLYELEALAYSEDVLANARDYSDVAVVVISRAGGESQDLPLDMAAYNGSEAGRSYLELTPNEEALLDLAKENFGTVVVLLNAANPMELGFLEDEGIDAALWMGFPGSTGCEAVGDILAGKVNPSGHVVDTFAYNMESAPSYYAFGDYDYSNINHTNASAFSGTGTSATGEDPYHYVDYLEGIYVGYRYYETAAADGFIDYDATVQFPFGYGLSYTSFEKSISGFSADGEKVVVNVDVTNTGSVAGKDVAQVYYTAPYTPGGIEKSEVVLGGFAKTKLLEPGETQTLTIEFTYEDMASYDYLGVKAEGGAYVLEAGEYEVSLRENSHDVLDSRTLTVDADVIYNDANAGARSTDDMAVTNRFDDVSFGEDLTYVSRADWAGTMPTEREPQSREASAKVIAAIEGEPLDNSETEDITFADHGLKLSDMKGLAYDDPAWEQLLEQISLNDMQMLVTNGGWETMAIDSIDKPYLMDADGPNGVNNIMANKLAGIKGTQFTCQSMLGYTWNVELAQRMGEAFGDEAAAYGLAGLYAPGVNIHRSPFGGRNFEYVSEDGLLSGKIVAAELNGIQSKGVYCYTKHFAVNDQETNRDSGGLVTWLNEQAMREIYLRGFEIAVKEGASTAMMSSFNRIGATPAAESWELLTGVLRDEWGFRGCVITDCVMAADTQDVNRALRAGNDLQLTVMGQGQLTEDTTGTAAGHQALRQATHNILYTIANSSALERANYGMSGIQMGVIIVDAVLVALFGLYLWRRHVGMIRWRNAGRPAGWLARKLRGGNAA